MIKNAITSYPIQPLIQQRWSPRSFADQAVEPVKIVQILEAARWSPSWRNDQPWRFIVATKDDREAYEQLFDCLNPGNQQWACLAPVLMIAVAKIGYDHSDQPNPMTLYDTGQAVAQLTIEALAHGLYVHQMGGIYHDRVRVTYSIPLTYKPLVALAVGYLGRSSDLPPDLRRKEELPRKRNPLSDLVFSHFWGLPWPITMELDDSL